MCLLLGRHAAGCDCRRPTRFLQRHHRGIEAGYLQRGIEDPVEQLVELDRGAEVTEEPISLRLALCALQGAREIPTQIVHLGPHLLDRVRESVVAVAPGTTRRRATACDGDHDDRDGDRGNDQGDDRAARHPCHRRSLSPVVRSGSGGLRETVPFGPPELLDRRSP